MHSVEEIADLFAGLEGHKVLVTTHAAPDGDALGSVCAVSYILETIGAEVKNILIDGFAKDFHWLLPPFSQVQRFEELGAWVPDIFICVDCGDGFRPGGEIAEYFGNKVLPSAELEKTLTVNIDHHLKNPLFGTYNIAQPDKAATAEIIGDIARVMEIPLAGALGEAVYTGIVTDTGNFTFSNTTSDIHAMVAEIVDYGLDVGVMTDKLYNNWSIARMHLWGKLMTDMSLHLDGRVVRSVISLDLLESFGADKEDLEGFAGWMRHLSGVDASLLVREDGPGKVKISVRSMGQIDVRAVAEVFGGGGHRAAAGATLTMPVEEAADAVLEQLIEEVQRS